MEVGTKTKFLPLFQRLSLNVSSAEIERYRVLPYDFHCPTAQKDLQLRICSECHLYFASKKSKAEHKKKAHPKVKQFAVPKRKSQRIIARRQKEIMCVVEDELTGAQDVEWLLEDDVIVEQEYVPADQSAEADVIVIESMNDWLRNEWTEI